MKKFADIFDSPLVFIADIGANHDGKLERAKRLIELAAKSGASAAKFQNFVANKIVSAKGFDLLGQGLAHQREWKKKVVEIYDAASISRDWTEQLRATCDDNGIVYFSSCYDFDSLNHIDEHVDLFKIGSGDITWLGMVDKTITKGKPVILATGASTQIEVDAAMGKLEKADFESCIMQCNTNYTADLGNFQHLNLRVLNEYRARYPFAKLGLSDHTAGDVSVLGALALGATFFEKHFTDDNEREGPDHKFAMNPAAWSAMVERAEMLYQSLGDGVKRVENNEIESAIVQRRGLYWARSLEVGNPVQENVVVALRPCLTDGISVSQFDTLMHGNFITAKPVQEGDPIFMGDLISSGAEDGK